MRGPGEGKGRGGGIPPSPVILGTRAAQGSSLSCTGKHACASACSNMPRCSRARMPKPFETPQDTCGYMKRAKRALDVSANRASSSTYSAIRTCPSTCSVRACTRNLGSLCRQGSQHPSDCAGSVRAGEGPNVQVWVDALSEGIGVPGREKRVTVWERCGNVDGTPTAREGDVAGNASLAPWPR